MLERIVILVVLGLIFWGAVVWISPKKTPIPEKPALKVEGWGDGYDDYCPMTLSAGHGGK